MNKNTYIHRGRVQKKVFYTAGSKYTQYEIWNDGLYADITILLEWVL